MPGLVNLFTVSHLGPHRPGSLNCKIGVLVTARSPLKNVGSKSKGTKGNIHVSLDCKVPSKGNMATLQRAQLLLPVCRARLLLGHAHNT